ncbi:hypothetical protein DH2020_038070 [Rehmannia glutinosa]|uniref:EF-hand domain-containing protein n=1 Tax=Rehmannia glutinosa TaxID=99300 RepID=A0ABR0V0C8_REHGL
MYSKISSAGLISIGNKASNIVSFISFILWCIFFSLIITFQDFYSCFRRVFQFFSYFLLDSCKNWCRFSSKINVECDVSTSIPCTTIFRDDVVLVMEKLGLHRDTKGQIGKEEPILEDSIEIANMFDVKEPCLDELGEAFGVFDENKDGFIDAEELNKVMKSIGLIGFCEQECQRMIMVFDDNCDGKIDFGEFVKLMEECCI